MKAKINSAFNKTLEVAKAFTWVDAAISAPALVVLFYSVMK